MALQKSQCYQRFFCEQRCESECFEMRLYGETGVLAGGTEKLSVAMLETAAGSWPSRNRDRQKMSWIYRC